MSIHPGYAEAILSGSKRVEYRKRRLASDVKVVLIYATAPVQRVVGRFTVSHHLVDTPAGLWERTGDVGGISKEAYMAYYGDSTSAVGIVISAVARFEQERSLRDLKPALSPPQSLLYLASDMSSAVSELAGLDTQLELPNGGRFDDLPSIT